eukprot:scaffold96532_cov31-Cyclotella_meneghiniana.AAC.1
MKLITGPLIAPNQLEGSDSKIKSVCFEYYSGFGREMAIYYNDDDGSTFVKNTYIYFQWKEIGQAIGRSTVLRQLTIYLSGAGEGDCVNAFLNGIKRNTSLQSLSMSIDGFSMFDLEYFMTNNRQLNKLGLFNGSSSDYGPFSDYGPLLSFQGRTIATAVTNYPSLKKLYMSCNFEYNDSFEDSNSDDSFDDSDSFQDSNSENYNSDYDSFEMIKANYDSFEQILLACSNIKDLRVRCNRISNCNDVADLLRNTTTQLRCLHIFEVVDGGVPVITAGLVGNNSLERLGLPKPLDKDDLKFIGQVLCDKSSIQSIRNSNHTLESIHDTTHSIPHELEDMFPDDENFPQLIVPDEYSPQFIVDIVDCLTLNKNEDKRKVVRQKIAKYYFVGDFDVSPFDCMPLSAMSEVLSTIGGENQCSAIYRMLKTIPALSMNAKGQQTEKSLFDSKHH